MRRRLAFRNERKLYRRNCSLTGDRIISQYPEKVAFPVIKYTEWHGDRYDPLCYGREIDWQRPLMEQFAELQRDVPRFSVIHQGMMDNSEYCQAASNNRNCYLIFSSNFSEDCMHSIGIQNCADVVDSYNVLQSTLCYECKDCYSCYSLSYASNCFECRDSSFLENCRNCINCLFCVDLVSGTHCLWNEPVGPERIQEERQRVSRLSRQEFAAQMREYLAWSLQYPRKYTIEKQTEDCVGNYLSNAKNCYLAFECIELESCSYVDRFSHSSNCMDISYWGRNVEWAYYCQGVGYNSSNLRFCNLCFDSCFDLTYCDHCIFSKNCILSVGLKRNQFCIFNLCYSQAEYERLLPRIINRLREEDIWGDLFPIKYSTYAYNDTVAMDYFPINATQAAQLGARITDNALVTQSSGGKKLLESENIPLRWEGTPEELSALALTCEQTGKLFSIVGPELAFYRKMNLPLPVIHPEERHARRISERLPRNLWERQCDRCKAILQTSFHRERPEIIYCTACYEHYLYH